MIPKPIYIEERRSGNTTRIVDYLIQELFIKGECVCYDHYFTSPPSDINRKMKRYVMDRVLQRIHYEHHIELNDLVVDSNEFWIKFKYINKL